MNEKITDLKVGDYITYSYGSLNHTFLAKIIEKNNDNNTVLITDILNLTKKSNANCVENYSISCNNKYIHKDKISKQELKLLLLKHCI